MTRKHVLTDRGLQALAAAPIGKRYVVWDAMTPHFGVRVTDKGAKSFIVVKRRAGASQPDVHVVGAYPATKLKAAREAVPGVLRTLADGNLPKEVKRQEVREAARRRADTFEVAVNKFIEWEKGRKLRSAHATATVLRREFLGLRPKRSKVASKRGDGQATEWVTEWTEGKDPVWRLRPIMEITRRDVIERLEEIKKRGGKYAARHALGAVRKVFNWAEEGERFGVTQSPAGRIRDKTIGISGRDLKRKRVLNDAELKEVWSIADAMGYPGGRLVQMLMLTGQRLNDIGQARWSELDLKAGVLRVPSERYKTGEPHHVPLTSKAIEILKTMPNFERGYLFTTTAGVRPVGSHSKVKATLDRKIAASREKAGEEPVPHWVLHDLRRTVRTRLSDVGVDAFIAERVLGHALPGLHSVYDQSTHSDQKRLALEKWQAQLLAIVEPPQAKTRNVVSLRQKRQQGLT